MKKVLVFRHVPHEGLGTLESFLNSRQHQIHYCDLFGNTPVPSDLTSYTAVISMGGPMNADETDQYPFLAQEREVLSKAIQLKKQVIGICLGSQLIARVLNARVYKGPQKEIGWYPIRLTDEGKKEAVFNQLPEAFHVFHWHGDTFDLPKGAVRLAESDLYPNQAFSFHNHVYAFQFHIEITSAMISEWIQAGEEELKGARIAGDWIQKDSPKYMPFLTSITDKIYPHLFKVAHADIKS